MAVTRCPVCRRDVALAELIDVGGRLLCGACQGAEAAQDAQRDSIDAALRAARSVARDGIVAVSFHFGAGTALQASARYQRINEAEPAAEIRGHTNIAQLLRELCAIVENLPAPAPTGGT